MVYSVGHMKDSGFLQKLGYLYLNNNRLQVINSHAEIAVYFLKPL